MNGWRYSHAGQVIEQFLEGKSMLQIDAGKLILQTRDK